MQRSSRAPVLSATRRRDSCWIIGLLGLLEHLREAPGLGLGQWPRLDDADDVAGLRHVGLVVRVELVRPANDLLVDRMRLHGVDAHDDRLVHRRRDHDAAPLLALSAGALARRLRALPALRAG